MYLQLFIINRSGGLVFNKNLSSMAPSISTNDSLRLGSTFHGLSTILPQIAPVVSSGIEQLETDTFILQCLQTLTGTKFVITATPGTSDLDAVLQAIYEIYSDYVLKVIFPSIIRHTNIIMVSSLHTILFASFILNTSLNVHVFTAESFLRNGDANSVRSFQSSSG